MTRDERVTQLGLMGFTARQAEFLAAVMLHSGWCLRRHYATFAGIPHGRKVCDFFEGLESRRYVTAWPLGHYRARAFHVHFKPLYRAIGEADNRHRRPVPLGRAIERMLVLDAVVEDRERIWLATESEKVAHFTLSCRIPHEALPALTFRGPGSSTTRYFPDKLPIGVDREGHTYTFLYLLVQDVPIDFRGFLERHAELLRRVPAWEIRLVVPAHKADAVARYRAAFEEQVASPLRLSTVDELQWYFRARQSPPVDADQRFGEAAEAFRAPRFKALYRAWRERGDSVLEDALSTTLAEAIGRGAGELECHVSSHRYLQLLPLIGTA